MKGLILKDLLNLSHYKTTLAITIIFIGIMCVTQESMMNYIPIILITMIGMIALSTFSYDEISKSDRYLLALPTSKKEIVKTKYIFMIGMNLVGAILSGVVYYVIAYFVFKQVPNIISMLSTILGGLWGVSIIECIQIPSIYKWGAERGRIQMFIIVAIVMAIIGGIIYGMNQTIGINIEGVGIIIKNFGIVILIGVTIFMYSISYGLSKKIYMKKEVS